MEQKIAYEPHPVSPERKAELRAQGYKIIDAKFAPDGYEHQAAAAQDGEGDKGVSDKLGVAELRGKLVELGIEFDPKAKKADLQALLDAAAQDGEGV